MSLPELDKLRIILYPDPALKKVAAPVGEFGQQWKALADRMLVLMKEAKGVGLAAPQVGISVRLFVCNISGEANDDMVFVNPRFVERTGLMEGEEGCLSIPGVSVSLRRSARAVIEACDLDGRLFQKTGEQMTARAWQHEMDHLNGLLITDNMSPTDEIANRRAIKQLEADYAAKKKRV